MNLRERFRGFTSLNPEIHSLGWESGYWGEEFRAIRIIKVSHQSRLLLHSWNNPTPTRT